MIARRTLLLSAAGLASAAILPAFADDYPSRPITVVCPYGAGGGLDSLYRFLAQRVQELAGQTVVFENRAGASGLIATNQVMRSKPDGYTLMLSVTPGMVGNPLSMKDARYDPIADFTAVATIAEISFILVVDPRLPIHSVAELTEHVRKKAGKVNYGAQSLVGILLSEFYKSTGKFEGTQISYKGMTDIAGDVVGGQLDFAFIDVGLAVAQTKSGRLRALATSAPKRIAAMPDLPTMVESGYPDVVYTPTMGAWLPAGVPRPIVDKLAGWLNQAVSAPETKQFLTVLGAEPLPGDGKLLEARERDEDTRLRKLISTVPVERL
jgi:tripartite-type tricarboxylate transporter receptor subunit TctC